jgi:hypothetical protein
MQVIEHLASHATPPELLDAMRVELRRLGHVPDAGLRTRRAGLEAAAKRVRDAFVWGHLGEVEYRSQRREIDRQLAELPAPADSNVLAFNRSAMLLLPFAETIREATSEH